MRGNKAMKISILKSQIKFIYVTRWLTYVPFLIFIIACLILYLSDIGFLTVRTLWTDVVDPLLSMALLLVAIALWFGEFHKDWMQSLPCLFTVAFSYDGKEVMRCEYADLASESDMRGLGQNIGTQMANVSSLKFKAAAIKQSGGNPMVYDNGAVYRHFMIHFELTQLPENFPVTSKDEMLVWRRPFDLPLVPEKRAL